MFYLMLSAFGEEQSARNEQAVRSHIRTELYPESLYALKRFPGIHDVVYKAFLEGVGRDPVKRSVFQTCNNLEELHSLVRSEVAFTSLLHHHTDKLLCIYGPMIKAFVQAVHRSKQDHEEVVQDIMAEMLVSKIRSIRKNYEFTYRKGGTFTAYFMAVVRNVYHDRMRTNRNDPLRMLDPDDDHPDSLPLPGDHDRDWMGRVVVVEECERFDRILSLFYRLRPRLDLCLKLKFRVPVRQEDVLRCFARCRPRDIEILTDDYREVNDQMMYDAVVTVFNRYEPVKNLGDSLRKWVNTKSNEIIAHLNTAHGRAVYNDELLEYLVIAYFKETEGKEVWYGRAVQ